MKTGKVVFNEKNNNDLIFYYDDIEHNGETFSLDDYDYSYSIGAEWNALAYHPEYTRIRDGYIKTIEIDKSMADYKPQTCAGWFTANKIVNEIKGLEYLDLSEAKSCERMFGECENLTMLDVSNFVAPKCESYMGMFEECIRLNKLNGLENFRTENCQDFGQMFVGIQVSQLDVSNFNTQNATNMFGMFASCQYLRRIQGLENFDTSNVISFSGMFTGCKRLPRIELSNFNTNSLRDSFDMFRDCHNIRVLDLSNWKIPYELVETNTGEIKIPNRHITDISCMFLDCKMLNKIVLSENFDTYLKITGMGKRMRVPENVEIKLSDKVKAPRLSKNTHHTGKEKIAESLKQKQIKTALAKNDKNKVDSIDI